MNSVNRLACLCLLTSLATLAHANLPQGVDEASPAPEAAPEVVAVPIAAEEVDQALLDESGWDGVVYPTNPQVASGDKNLFAIFGGAAQPAVVTGGNRRLRRGRHSAGQESAGGGASSCGGSGMASWYGPGFKGRHTASGERFNASALTAAHKRLPFGTQVQVTNLRTQRSIVVRINDRGPFVRGRVIDLSPAAAHAIGMSGTIPVHLSCF